MWGTHTYIIIHIHEWGCVRVEMYMGWEHNVFVVWLFFFTLLHLVFSVVMIQGGMKNDEKRKICKTPKKLGENRHEHEVATMMISMIWLVIFLPPILNRLESSGITIARCIHLNDMENKQITYSLYNIYIYIYIYIYVYTRIYAAWARFTGPVRPKCRCKEWWSVRWP